MFRLGWEWGCSHSVPLSTCSWDPTQNDHFLNLGHFSCICVRNFFHFARSDVILTRDRRTFSAHLWAVGQQHRVRILVLVLEKTVCSHYCPASTVLGYHAWAPRVNVANAAGKLPNPFSKWTFLNGHVNICFKLCPDQSVWFR